MRVLHVAPFVSVRAGGVPTFVTESAAALAGLGVESTIVASDLGEPPTVGRPRTIQPDEYPPQREKFELQLFPVRAPRGLLRSPQLARYLACARGFDLIHVHSLWMHMHFAAGRVARRSGVPLVISPHGTLDPLLLAHRRLPKAVMRKLWQDAMLERAQLIHVTSETERAQLETIAPEVPRAVVPCGVDVRALSSGGDGARFRQRHGIATDAPLVMFLGRITFKKRLDILIDAFAQVAASHPAARLAIVGPDDEQLRAGLDSKVTTATLSDRVVFTGPLFGGDRDDALAAADVWALTSQTENFGIAVIEALAAGCAVVASHGVSIADELADAGGLVAIDLDASATARAIAALIDDAESRSALARRGRELASGFDWSVIAPRLKTVYEGVVGG